MFLLQNGNIASTHYRTSSLVTSTSLAKLVPQVQFPTTEGVDGTTDIIEKKLRQAAADEAAAGQRPERMYYLLLGFDEYVRWRQRGVVNSHAREGPCG